MLSSQADELRGYALSVRNVALRTTSLCHEARRDLLDSAVRMEQAADTIISLRDRLQDAELGRGTCEYVIEDNMNETEGMGDVWFRCTNCGTSYDYYADEWLLKMPYCPKCGCEVER